jgi:hypothetical protein
VKGKRSQGGSQRQVHGKHKGEEGEETVVIGSSDEDEGSAGLWTDEETLKLLEWLLGPDNTARYEDFMKSPTHCMKKVI